MLHIVPANFAPRAACYEEGLKGLSYTGDKDRRKRQWQHWRYVSNYFP